MSGKRLFYLFCLLTLMTSAYLFTTYKNVGCIVSTRQSSIEKGAVSAEELEELKKNWIAEYLEKNEKPSVVDEPPNDGGQKLVQPIECYINNDYPVSCMKEMEGDETVYMPFSFLQKYFEVYGKMKHYDGYDRFEFLTSFAKEVKKPAKKYSYKGVFMTFESYNVETRDRVKCISAVQGVPVSTQWGPQGYFYPIQIAQFGLSHYSKELVQKPAQHTVYESGKRSNVVNWKLTSSRSKVEVIQDKERGSVVHIATAGGSSSSSAPPEASLSLGNTIEHVVSFDFKFITNGSITFYVDTNNKKQYKIHYVTRNFMLGFDYKLDIEYGLGEAGGDWRRLTRDLLVDLRKGVSFTKSKQIKKNNILIQKVSKVVIKGECLIDNITLSTTKHMDHFHDAVRWMYKNQDEASGGWRNDIERKVPGFNTLKPGWISAMGQGQAMSLLARAYYMYNDTRVIKALSRALKPFTIRSSEGGVKAVFMDRYTWYEEYPTTPSLFVLNGFLYSLIGLYDFKTLIEEQLLDSSGKFLPEVVKRFQQDGVDIGASYKLVSQLWEDGMTSAKAMLPLYDGGSRTFYDLRHFVLKTQPNVARWDYHATHLCQLALLSTVSDDPVFKQFFDFWQGYTKGKVAEHN